MSDSSSDESSGMEYVAAAMTKQKKQRAAVELSCTGSHQQPLSIDDSDASSAASILEVAPPKKKEAAAKSKLPKSRLLESDSSDDSDDSLLKAVPIFQTTKKKNTTTTTTAKIPNKQSEQQRKLAEQERKKAEKLAQKQAEQARKKAEREQKKADKTAEKEAAKESRKRQRLEQQAARGNFATSEIVMLVDPPLLSSKDAYDWTQHEEITTHNCAVHEYRSALVGNNNNCQAIQWIRKNHLQGGAASAWDELRKNNPNGYTHMDRLVLVFDDPKVFIDLLRRTKQDNADDDYPKLRQWLLQLQHTWKAAWPQSTPRPRILLLLHQAERELDRQWVEYRRKTKNSTRRDAADQTPPDESDFRDAITWLLIQYQVECMCCDSLEEIWTTALKMTRALAKGVYKKIPMTELECVKRLKPSTGDNDQPLVTAKDVWLRQLQQVQGISENKARNLVRHYPTIQSLHQGYEESDDPQELVAGCLHATQYQQKLSENVHRLLTSTNPEEIV
ncbi:expressed unknown protein [Seminavis robusta]|uniref:Crossover junction endonuclease EME1 n=1 Tax=Seminavis robusta TaxID=568900 RepID=A0A9N8HM98_9STRA|nr:expressed unknown protein [Seminavis robusta]|eukprot:Sro1097_g240900.1 n/a (504) ;mRNA; r:29094-30605